jgi:hypothetical protein
MSALSIFGRAEVIDETNLVGFIAALRAQVRPPFDPAVLEMLGRLSKSLMKDTSAPPAFIALGYWLRPAALAQYQREFAAGLPGKSIAAPRGVALHLPPTNVDTIFVYSWALSLLAGNANLVRLPSGDNPALDRLLGHIRAVLDASPLVAGNVFVNYPSAGSTTAALSAVCDLRIIWGGDEKVLAVSALPMRPGGVTVPFPDRYSYAVFGVSAYLALEDGARDQLADKAFNDVFLFDQMACSSSRIVFWLEGAEPYEAAAKDFSARLAAAAEKRTYDVAPATRMAKFLFAHQVAIDLDLSAVDVAASTLTSIYLRDAAGAQRVTQGGGVLMHVAIKQLEEIGLFAIARDQTLTHFGVSLETLQTFARDLCGRGVDRIVPVGEALQFDRVWDGFDLLRSFSKLVVVR